MIDNTITFEQYLSELNKKNINEILDKFQKAFTVHNQPKEKNIEKKKKQDIINYLLKNIDNYLKCIIISLDRKDYQSLEDALNKSPKKNPLFQEDYKDLANYLEEAKILYQKDQKLILLKDLSRKLKKHLKEKSTLKKRATYQKLINRANGLIIAYGVIKKEKFSSFFTEEDDIYTKINASYKKDIKIEDKRLISSKLTNKKKITDYLKKKDCKEFKVKEIEELGNKTYHKKIKSYQKLAKILKNNYVFKKKDLDLVDEYVIIPYLYKSINEEEIANKELNDAIIKLFELNGEKLKDKMIEQIKKIRDDFPLWEYGGYSKNEVSK